MQSKAATVEQYLAELPSDRRETIQDLRKVFLKNMDKRIEEGMQYGMIGYYVPHSIYPPGYHCDPKLPLCFAGLASQKNHLSMYLVINYVGPAEAKRFRSAWEKTGRKLDMGKCCIRFKKTDDVPLDVLADFLRDWPVEKYIKFYESVMRSSRKKPAAKKRPSAARKVPSPKRTVAAASKRTPNRKTSRAPRG